MAKSTPLGTAGGQSIADRGTLQAAAGGEPIGRRTWIPGAAAVGGGARLEEPAVVAGGVGALGCPQSC
jgi:hypothetical protein